MNFVFAEEQTYKQRKRTYRACERCRKRRIRCEVVPNTKSCTYCQEAGTDCKRDITTLTDHVSEAEESSEQVYEKVIRDQNRQVQFVSSTQPLAALLSRDALLFFDGDRLGYYRPWTTAGDRVIDPDLKEYLSKRGAYRLPAPAIQQRLVSLYLDNFFPIYPVVQRSVLKHLSELSPLLIDAMMLVGARYDTTLENPRAYANELYKKCNLLALVEQDKIALIQSYLLMSVHEEGQEGPNATRELIAKACTLCGEIAITNADGKGADRPNDTSRGEKYSKGLIARIFWTSFCCDRLVAVTSGRAMVYNRQDLIIHEPCLADFEGDENAESDFAIFNDWYQLQNLIERIICARYRPPGRRTLDDYDLEKDIMAWTPTSTSPHFLPFLSLTHVFSSLLYFRTKITSVSFIEEPPSTAIEFVRTCSDNIRLSIPQTHHICIVHAILHVISISYLDLLLGGAERNASPHPSPHTVFEECLKHLASLKKTWWLAAASHLLCLRLKDRLPTSTSTTFEMPQNNAAIQELDLIALLFEGNEGVHWEVS